MHTGTAISTFMIHDFTYDNLSLNGAEIINKWLKNIQEELDLSIAMPGELVFFLADRSSSFSHIAPKAMQRVYAVLKVTMDDIAYENNIPPEEMEEIESSLADIMVMEITVLKDLLNHVRHFKSKRAEKSTPKLSKRNHKHPILEDNLYNFTKKLKEDDNNYRKILNEQ